jgi:serine/threonine protein phosphatase PrpC
MKPYGKLEIATGFDSRCGRREANEDYCGTCFGAPGERSTHGIVAALADGVGGAKGGRVAAELAVRSFVEGYYATPPTLGVGAGAAQALGSFNRWLHAIGRVDPELEGAASTFTALVVRARQAHVLHVGDSRAWLFRDGRLVQLTEDHVLPQPDLRHVLFRAVGLERSIRLDHRTEELAVHDRLLLTSDGVHGTLNQQIIARLLGVRCSPEADAEAIVNAAIDAGSADNATALIIDILDLPPADFDSLAESAASLPILPPPVEGETVDGFLLERMISDGRYTRIFVAREHESGRELALKFPKPSLLSDHGAKLAFVRETMVGSRVKSPFVGEVVLLPPERQSRLYGVLVYYPGETLEARIAKGPLGLSAGLLIAPKLARGVAALHRLGIVHRDIKPDNVLLGEDGAVKLIDLGVARLPRVEEFAGSEIPGTPSYMAPELFAGEIGSEASDQFAIGVTLYRMFTGRYPYGEVEAFSRPRFGQPLRPNSVRPELPAWLDAAMVKAVAVRPEDRFGDVVELLYAIEGGSARAVRPKEALSLYERHPTRFWQVIALILAIALLFALAWR